jgi:hypothetical protein
MIRFFALYRDTARQNDAVNGPGASRADAIAMLIGLIGFAVIAVFIAAITGGA